MKLKDCCTIIAGQSPESKYYNTEGIGIPFFQGKADFGEVYPTIRVYCSQPTKIAEKDDILLSVRAPVGPTNLSPGRVCIGRGLTAIRPSEILNLTAMARRSHSPGILFLGGDLYGTKETGNACTVPGSHGYHPEILR